MPAVDVKHLFSEIVKAENEVKELKAKLESLKEKFELKQHSYQTDEGMANIKLKHRIAVLKNSIEEEEIKSKQPRSPHLTESNEASKGIREALSILFSEAIEKAFPGMQVANPVTPSTKPHFGDYQCNAAMQIANQLKSQGISTTPLDVASSILQNLSFCELFDRVEKVNPGFLNIWISKEFYKQQIQKIIIDGVSPPLFERKLKVIVDFSSPNIAKEMHVGHLRSTVIGDSICRLLEFMGHDVVRLNHVGDWGTQFGMLIAHLQDKFPNYLSNAPPIADLQTFYKESKSRFDEDADFKNKAYSSVVKLQNFDPDYIKAWNLICDASRKEFQLIYDKLGIQVTERGESFYQNRMVELVKFLEKKGFLENDDGRKMLFCTSKDLIPLTIVKSDGGFTYDTSDLAALKQRIEEEKAEWIVYVTDSGQATHFKCLYDCAEKVGILDKKKIRVDHVGFGVVLGEDKKKFKTRSGETVRLNDLLEEGIKRAEQKLIEKNRHTVLSEEELKAAKLAVAYGCIKYSDLSHNRIIDYVFSFDKMLEDKGNTAVYLLYALTRIRSISRNAGISSEDIRNAASKGDLKIEHEKEWKLVKCLLKFKDILIKVTEDLLLHSICEFLYEVACNFTEFYDNCYCIMKNKETGRTEISLDRLVLCEATALIMEKCFNILGLQTVSKM